MLLVLDLPGPKRSEKNNFVSYGLFLTSSCLNLLVYFYFLLRGCCGAALPPMAVEGALLFKVLLFFVGLKSCYVEV